MHLYDKMFTTNGKNQKIPYKFSNKAEYEEYIRVCEQVDGWGGIPLDIGWARGTNLYQETLKRLNHDI